ncbi:MAG: tetratricopeptide repeat protein, partial [Neisseriaceae bacterium]
MLAAQLALAQGQNKKALETYATALQRYPDSPGLTLGQIETMLQLKEAKAALNVIGEQKSLHGGSARLFRMEAEAHALLGNSARQHQALAEYFAREGNPREALTQIHIALKAAGGDFYLQSSLEARQRELRA